MVSRQFCFRYGSETVPLAGNSTHSSTVVTPASATEPAQVEITLHQRKIATGPVNDHRRCICSQQGRALCGVCVVAKRWRPGRIFQDISYGDGLAVLKGAAQLASLPRPLSWGTHCFRRGWADDVLQAGYIASF